jgi:hypothetical protein
MIISTVNMQLAQTATAVQNGSVTKRRQCVPQLHVEHTAEKP